MNKRLLAAFAVLLALGLGLALLPGCRTHTRPLSIILMISDGCGYNCFDLAGFYQHGRRGAQVYDSFPVRLAVSTHSASGIAYDPRKAWASFDFVLNDPTDSAAAATALATGVKIHDDVVGLSPDGQRLRSIIDVAESSGKKTGIVTSVPFCHATPAGFLAHAVSRYMYEDIARQIILESPVDVVMGCGHPYFDRFGRPAEKPNFRYVGGAETWRALVRGEAGADADGDGRPDPWTLVETAEALPALSVGPIPSRVFFIAPVFRTLQQERVGNALADPFEVPLLQTVPTLEEMALAALNILDTDPDGFFLMVEGGAVDWAAEDNQTSRLIEEQIFFNRTVEAVVDWIQNSRGWKDTLIIVTSDHETGYIPGPGSGQAPPNGDLSEPWNPLMNKGKGKIPNMEWHSDDHTNMLVPLFAKGRGSERLPILADERDPVRGDYVDNAEIGRFMMELLQEEGPSDR